MQSEISEIKALAITYILLFLLLMLGIYALWIRWYLTSLPMEHSSQHGAVVRGAPALLTMMVVPPMLLVIRRIVGPLLTFIRRQWKVFSLLMLFVFVSLASTVSLLLAAHYEFGAADRAVGAVLLVPLTILVFAGLGCSVAIMLDEKAASR